MPLEDDESDHRSILLNTNSNCPKLKTLFYFDERWLNNNEIEELIKIAWEKQVFGNAMYQVAEKIKSCREILVEWKRTSNPNSRQCIKSIQKQLHEVKSKPIWNEKKVKWLEYELKTEIQNEECYLV